ncbi:MAG: hypothetical protein K9J16_10230 [Melioribacteraceae bacterium]|nr:hypothetical protein [Melioribacteraceae bacterium]MCF8353390.1 hypothetical protein [Melioribacteraceae bacterium]MCF8393031.1 hypothetical protein [Melioribacteraceae bacterium]MCF8419116.1 hypothetical protein [Melioribacteraceae bacterium]
MKKVLILLFALFLVFTGCSKDDDPASPNNNTNTLEWESNYWRTVNGLTDSIKVKASFNVTENTLTGSGTFGYGSASLSYQVFNFKFTGTKTDEQVTLSATEDGTSNTLSYTGTKTEGTFGELHYEGDAVLRVSGTAYSIKDLEFPY